MTFTQALKTPRSVDNRRLTRRLYKIQWLSLLVSWNTNKLSTPRTKPESNICTALINYNPAVFTRWKYITVTKSLVRFFACDSFISAFGQEKKVIKTGQMLLYLFINFVTLLKIFYKIIKFVSCTHTYINDIQQWLSIEFFEKYFDYFFKKSSVRH